MLTMREAHQRVSFNRFSLRREGTNFTIHPLEGNSKIKDYTSDDIEDVVLMAGRLRHHK